MLASMSTMSDEQLASVLAVQNSNVEIEEVEEEVDEKQTTKQEIKQKEYEEDLANAAQFGKIGTMEPSILRELIDQNNSYQVEPIAKVDDQTGATEDASAVVNSVLGDQNTNNVDLVPVTPGIYNKFKNCCYHKCPGNPGKKKPRPCMMCAKVLYCCRECQTGDMQRHKKECEGRKPKPKAK